MRVIISLPDRVMPSLGSGWCNVKLRKECLDDGSGGHSRERATVVSAENG